MGEIYSRRGQEFAATSAGYVRASKGMHQQAAAAAATSTLGKGCPMSATGSTGTTVTLFGNSDPIDLALSDQLEQRGCKTHFVSVPTGWLRSASHAVMRLDTEAGAEAFKELADTRQPRSHVIAVCPETADAAESARVRDMCRACGRHHDVSLIWHPPLDGDGAARQSARTKVTTNALAATVAAEMVEHSSVGQPSFVTRPFLEAGPH